MNDRLQDTDHSACPRVGARPLRWSAVVVSRGLKAGVMDSTPHPRSTHTGLAAAVCAILGASLLAVGAVLMKPVESSGISARIDGANGSIDPYQESNMKTLHAFRTAGALSALAVTQIALVSGASAQVPAVQWRSEDGGNGHWYELVDETFLTQPEAVVFAASRGGELISVTSPDEYAFLLNRGFDGCWLGGQRQVANPSNWEWLSGEPWSYAVWANDPHYSSEPWLVLISSGTWCCGFGDSGPSLFRAAIEWSADCNKDDIVDYGQILTGQLVDSNANGDPDCCEEGIPCSACYAYDLNPTGIVDGADLGALLAFWGPVSPAFPRADINRDGNVNGADLGLLLANWGPCGQ